MDTYFVYLTFKIYSTGNVHNKCISNIGICHVSISAVIPNMLEILDQLPDSYLAFAGRLSEITARAMAYGIEGAGRMRYTLFAHAQ
jgi:hypothetical protein